MKRLVMLTLVVMTLLVGVLPVAEAKPAPQASTRSPLCILHLGSLNWCLPVLF